VRGDLTEGGSVHLLIDEQIWLPASPVARVDEAMASDVLDDLQWQAQGHRAEATARHGRDTDPP
jgi:hypothetical protein